MGDSNSELIKAIVHYQQCLEKYTRRNNEPRMLYCIGKLYKLPITVDHLERTGVGRTVNSLRKISGEAGEAAKSLVARWKEMVVGEDDDDDDDEPKKSSTKPDHNKIHREESKNKKSNKEKTSSSSSHKESDKRSSSSSGSKHNHKEKHTSSRLSNDEQPPTIKKEKDTLSESKKRNESERKHRNKYDHKSKSVESSDNSESEKDTLSESKKRTESDRKHRNKYNRKSKSVESSDNSESDNGYVKSKNTSYNHKSSKHKTDRHSRNKNSHKSEKDIRNHSRHKSLKRKREESDEDSSDEDDATSDVDSSDEEECKKQYDRTKVKLEKLSDESDLEEENKTYCHNSQIHHGKIKEEVLIKKEYEDSDEQEYKKRYDKAKVKIEKMSSESDTEEQVKKYSHTSQKHHSKHKEDVPKKKEDKYSHKHLSKIVKKEPVEREKPAKHANENKSKDKHVSNSEKDKRTSEKLKKEESRSKSSNAKHRDKEHHKSTKQHSNKKETVYENGIESGSGTSFAEALGMLVPSSSKLTKKKTSSSPFSIEKSSDNRTCSSDNLKKDVPSLLLEKKIEPLEINLSNLLPEITPNYRPLGNFPLDSTCAKNKMTAEEEALSAIMYSKISRTKVYSGNKVIWGKVPSLFDLCTHVLQDNIDALEYTGGVPYSILKTVIDRATPDQLFMLEHHNPYLIEDTDELWLLHCQREFRNKKREEMETWRDMYMRCLDEREAKLKALTANIKQAQDKSLPVRQTKLAYVDSHSIVKPPRNIAKKQAKHGTGGYDKKPLVTPTSRLSTHATAGAAGLIAVPNPGARAAHAGGSTGGIVKVKKAPLMQKTLAFMKNRLFRR